MNRHGIVNLLIVIGFLAVIGVTTLIVAGAFFAPTAVRNAVGDVGVLIASVVWAGIVLLFLVFSDQIYDWAYHRYELSDQSPTENP